MNQGEFIVIRALADVDKRIDYLRQLLSEWDFTAPLSIKWGKYTSPRTLNQNALFHMWMSEGSKHFSRMGKQNVDPERLKILMKYRFLGTTDIEVGSHTVPGILRSTKKLDRAEMTDFMGKVEAWLLDMGVRITIPADSEYAKLREAQQ